LLKLLTVWRIPSRSVGKIRMGVAAAEPCRASRGCFQMSRRWQHRPQCCAASRPATGTSLFPRRPDAALWPRPIVRQTFQPDRRQSGKQL